MTDIIRFLREYEGPSVRLMEEMCIRDSLYRKGGLNMEQQNIKCIDAQTLSLIHI